MIIQGKDMNTEIKKEMRGGKGEARILHLAPPENLCSRARLFGQITLDPGCSIGYHEHHGESELFYILSGQGQFSDNGALHPVHPGDCAICPDGQGHAIENTGGVPLVFVALILYAGEQ